MVLHLGVFAAIQGFDLVDFAIGTAIGPGAEEHARGGQFAAGTAVLALAAATFIDREHAGERPFDPGGPIVLVKGGHDN
jgi:hypothetical protein